MKYTLNKFIQMLITLVIVSVIIFLAVHSSGDPVRHLLPTNATEQMKQEMTRQLGLDKPLIEQYGMFIGDAVRGDFGTSYSSSRPVREMIAERLPYTLELSFTALIVGFIVTVVFGSLAALKKDTVIDRIITGIAAVFQSSPIFFLAILAIQFFGVTLHVLPVSGADSAANLIMPAGLLGLAISADMTVLLRNNMIQTLQSDYIKFCRLKGLSEFKVVFKHALRNSISSVLALSSFILANLVAGSVVIESIFSWPGIGMLSYESVIARDYPVVQAIVLILAVFVIVLSFIIDSAQAALDPRIRRSL